MGKTMLTLNDFHKYLTEQNKDILYRATNKEEKNIVVQLEELFKFQLDDDYDPDELKHKVHMKLCHTDVNDKKSSIEKSVMEKAIPSAYNMPILGYIWEDKESGEYYFAGHEMYKEDNEIVYLETPVGVVTDNLQLVFDEDANVYRLEGDGVIWEKYSKAYDILQREKELYVSCELSIDSYSFNSKTNILVIEEFHFSGVTILGKDIATKKDIQPGMAGSNITIQDFSAENNSLFNENILNEIKKLNEKFESLQIEFSKKGESQLDKFNELLKKYSITSEQVEFDYEGLSDEELETKFAEVFGSDESGNSGEAGTEGITEGESASDGGTENNSAGQVEPKTNNENFALTLSDGTKNFSLSYNEIEHGLYNLFNEAHGDEDNWFCIENVYDNNTAVFQNWFDNKYYRQSFEVENENVSLTGEPEEVFARFVNEAEKTALDMLQSNYDSAKTELEKYQAEEKELHISDLLNSSVYEDIKESEKFIDLVNNHADFSVDEVKTKADNLLLEYVYAQKTQEVKENNEKNSINFSVREITETKETKKRSRYGGLFKSSK